MVRADRMILRGKRIHAAGMNCLYRFFRLLLVFPLCRQYLLLGVLWNMCWIPVWGFKVCWCLVYPIQSLVEDVYCRLVVSLDHQPLLHYRFWSNSWQYMETRLLPIIVSCNQVNMLLFNPWVCQNPLLQKNNLNWRFTFSFANDVISLVPYGWNVFGIIWYLI